MDVAKTDATLFILPGIIVSDVVNTGFAGTILHV